MNPKYDIGKKIYFLLDTINICQGIVKEINIKKTGIKYKISYKTEGYHGYKGSKSVEESKISDNIIDIENQAYNEIDKVVEKWREQIRNQIKKLEPKFNKISKKELVNV